jgi:hypothetical protein
MAAPEGNKNATKNKYWSDALRKYITQNPSELEKAAEAIFAKAKEGDVQAIKEIGDRLEGKAVQRVEGSGEGGEFEHNLTVKLIAASAK